MIEKYRRGETWIWCTGGGLGLILLMAATLMVVVVSNGLSTYWAKKLVQVKLVDGSSLLGEEIKKETQNGIAQTQYKIGNRDIYGLDFRWVVDSKVASRSYPENAITVERMEYGNLYGLKTPQGITAGDKLVELPADMIVRSYQPNTMSVGDKVVLFGSKIWELLFDNPRESNTEGGLFPAIFGTVSVVFLMAISFFPIGVVAGIYLSEYATDGILVKVVRITVNNLAGVPSIVYGIFGLGFFVYTVGSTIDQLFFSQHLPEPTFGTGGVLWASLTLGLLTVPVVIVATEEALGTVPGGVREASLALGATKLQTLLRILLPMASPGIMTGFILAMARAAGEVAPLMITGVVKMAPSLPLDGAYPFVHLNRKFMHLGFHIYDVGFQSPNAEAAMPMVFVTTLLLVGIVVVLSSSAIILRNVMKKRLAIKTI